MTLIFSGTFYSQKISPEDWIMFWAFNNFDDYKRAYDAVTARERANHFKNAPKFVGRVQTIFEDIRVDGDSGKRHLFYNLTAAGFSELDSNMYFDQTIQRLRPEVSKYWSDMSNAQSKLSVAGLITGSKAIPFLLRVCLGLGPGAGATGQDTSYAANKDPNNPNEPTKVVISPNQAYLIPNTVTSLLLAPSSEKQKPYGSTYADLIKTLIGVQEYGQTPSINPLKNPESIENAAQGFFPKFKSKSTSRVYRMAHPITGTFVAQPLMFNNQSVWSILKTYLVEPINEMYTCLRVDEEGYVVPTLVVRQLPLSTPNFSSNYTATNYLSLPRWNIDDNLILSRKSGCSNALRYNYTHVMPINFFKGDEVSSKALTYIYSLPVADSADIKRAGLRPLITTVGATISITSNDSHVGRFWNKLMADILFGSHLKYTGTVVLKGVNEPICEGDNCVVDNVIYHIERVMHSGHIDQSGKKDFSTTLQLSNGLSADSDDSIDIVYPNNTETEPWVPGITAEN